jgi:FMN phosphatase YigB (HAD superfamily)
MSVTPRGSLILIDIDGTLADTWSRDVPADKWEQGLEKVSVKRDPVALLAYSILQSYPGELFIVTGRHEKLRSVTLEWLNSEFLSPGMKVDTSVLVMRPDDYVGHAHEWKIDYINNVNPFLVIDDDPPVIKHCKNMGIQVIEASG